MQTITKKNGSTITYRLVTSNRRSLRQTDAGWHRDLNVYLHDYHIVQKEIAAQRKARGMSYETYRDEYIENQIRYLRSKRRENGRQCFHEVTITDKQRRTGYGESPFSLKEALEMAKSSLRNRREDSRFVREQLRPGWALERLIEKRAEAILHNEPRPRLKEKHLGIEIECYTNLTRENLAKALAKAKIPNGSINVTDDGSLRAPAGKYSCELRVLVRESTLEDIVTRICKVLNDNGGVVNNDCGLHVHLDCRTGIRRGAVTFDRLNRALPLLAAMVPASRRRNEFCKLNSADDTIDDFADEGDRYYAINGDALHRHGTIEVRLHTGTINATKIINWCRLLGLIADCENKSMGRKTKSLKAWKKYLKMPKDLTVYVAQRITLFGPTKEIIVNVPVTLVEEQVAATSEITETAPLPERREARHPVDARGYQLPRALAVNF